MSIQKGDKAPAFKLISSDLKEVSLEDYKGKKLVVHFFPMAFTSTCTEQLCTMRDTFGYYEGLGADVIGISVDSPFTLAQFKKEQNYQFPLLSDFNKEASQAFDAYYEQFYYNLKGVSKRAAFVINENQEVVYA